MSSIKISNLNFEYQQNHQTLQNVNVQFEVGKFSLLIGPSGSGKSTLLKILSALYPQFGGKISAGSFEIPENLSIGMVFQNPNRQFTLDTPRHELEFVMENLKIDPADMPTKIQTALAFCEVTNLIDQRFDTLSGGERQKVALAIVIAMNRDIILLDEPFASVDPEARRELITKLVELRDTYGKTIILADHDLQGYKQDIDAVFQIQGKSVVALDNQQTNSVFAEFERQLDFHHVPIPDELSPIDFGLHELSIRAGDRTLLKPETRSLIKGKTTLLTGANGIGKSTLLLSLAKLHPFQGQILYQEQDITKIKLKRYFQHVALIFQDAENQFLTVTVEEEIILSKQHRHSDYFSDSKIEKILVNFELDDLKGHVIYSLSEGQKKKLQILLLLIVEPNTLLLDEPLKGLDFKSIAAVVKVINESQINSGQTVIMISHQLTGLTDFVDFHLHFANQQLTYLEDLS